MMGAAAAWIEAGAPGPAAKERVITRLNITPNDLLCSREEAPLSAAQLFAALDSYPESSRQTALHLLDV